MEARLQRDFFPPWGLKPEGTDRARAIHLGGKNGVISSF